jgi:hypothetical protein
MAASALSRIAPIPRRVMQRFKFEGCEVEACRKPDSVTMMALRS